MAGGEGCLYTNDNQMFFIREDGEKGRRRIGGRRGYCPLHGGKLVKSVSGRYRSEAMGEKQNVVTLSTTIPYPCQRERVTCQLRTQ